MIVIDIGRPLSYTPDEFYKMATEYIAERANIGGIATGCGLRAKYDIPKTTYYRWRKNPQFNAVFELIDDKMEDCNWTAKDVATKLFWLKAKKGLSDNPQKITIVQDNDDNLINALRQSIQQTDNAQEEIND